MLDRMPVELVVLRDDPPEARADVLLAVGEVTGCGPAQLRISVNGAEVAARRALSCLVTPELGDRVLAAAEGQRHFVLSVLERAELRRAELSLPAADAAMTLAAGEIELSAGRRIRHKAPEIRLEANTMGLFARSLSLVGNLLNFLGDRLHSSVSQQHTVADQIATKARQRVTVVDGTDVQKIGALSQSVDTTAAITAEAAIVTTRKDLRLDGERISMG